ncbi:WxL protein peptidoglycan domain-containing protein [Agromyces sp. MMS24-K17]|uniref:WxL protein peptidoglycan domain-containing protein n=1 Tax=Agromyces sp. MMS24-K17 TaxID=3372850 RepID=UPI003753F7C4
MHARPSHPVPAGLLARVIPIAVAAALAAGAALAGAAPAAAEEGPDVTWGVRPAAYDGDDARQNYAYQADPGETIEDAIIVANHDTAPIELDVYAADGFTTAGGQLDVATRDARAVDIGKWLLPAADRIVVQPGEAVEVPFTLAVPANATPGDHAGAILTALTRPDEDEGLTVDRRLGIRIHLRVGGELAPALAIENLRVDYGGTLNPFGSGEATVAYTVRNAGNVRLSAAQAVTLTGPFGMLPVAATGVDPVPELLPGETWPVTVRVAGVVPAFGLTASVALDPSAPEGTERAPKRVEASATTAAVPWTLLVLVLLVAGGIALWIVLGRKRRAARAAAEEARVQEAVAAALRERDAQAEAEAEAPADASPEPAAVE